MPIFMSKALFHLSVVWRGPCRLLTALGSRCHLEGPVTATVASQELGSPGPAEALQGPAKGYASKQPWHFGFRGDSCRGSSEKIEEGDMAGS